MNNRFAFMLCSYAASLLSIASTPISAHESESSSSSSFSASSLSSSSLSSGKFSFGDRYRDDNLPPWISKKGDTFIYKFNFFNLVPDQVSQETLQSILDAQIKDIENTYRKDWGATIDIKLYGPQDVINPELFEGDRMPFYIGSTAVLPPSALGYHCVQVSGEVNQNSWAVGSCNIQQNVSVNVPDNFPDYVPYGVAAYNPEFIASVIANNNPYGPHDALQGLSTTINHEIKEILGDDSLQMFTIFDTYAPAVADWHFAKFSHGIIQNGTVGPDGYVHLPSFNEQFPAGGFFYTNQENADCVSRGRGQTLNAYFVDGWAMTNYPNSNFWRAYFKNDKIKWDYKGYLENPVQPYAAIISGLYFLDFATGITYFGQVENWGPVTVSQRGDPLQNNFPPDYTYVSFLFDFGSNSPEALKATVKKPRTLRDARRQALAVTPK